MPTDRTIRGASAYQQMAKAHLELPADELDDREALKNYQLGVVGYSVFATIKEAVTGSADGEDEPKSAAARALDDADALPEASPEMVVWRDALGKASILPLAELHFSFGKPEYERLLREIVQGAMAAAKELRTPYQTVIRILIVFLMNICPHGARPQAVRYLAKTLAYEVTLCKLTIGLPMKLSAYAIGESIFMLAMQDALMSRPDGPFFDPSPLLVAANEGNWKACQLITPNSLAHLEDNGNYLVRGFSEAEKRLRKAMVAGTVEKVLNLPVIGWVYRPLRWMVRVASHKIKETPFLKKVWDKLME